MTRYLKIFNQLAWLRQAIYFFRIHYPAILGLGMVAALGRVVQLEAFGTISTTTHLILEVIIESSRMLIFVFVIGIANFKGGFYRLKRFWTHKNSFRVYGTVALQKFKKEWLLVLINLFVFAGIAGAINFLIDVTAYETCLLINLKQQGILVKTASEWSVILFFKNLSVIPFTIIFNALFLLWITNKLQNFLPSNSTTQ